MIRPELSIIIPCYNESQNIPLIAERLSIFWPEVNFELVFVNNGSTDDSSCVLEDVRKKYSRFIRIISIEKNVGYGYGILSGLKAAQAGILAYTHADIQTPPEDIIKGYYLLKQNMNETENILIKGLRLNRRKEEQFLTQSLSKAVEIMLGYKMEDINGQPKIFHRSLLENFISPPADFSFDVYVMYMAKLRGLKVITFPVDFGKRIHGESKWNSGTICKYKAIFKYMASIFKIAVTHRSAIQR